MGTLSLIFGIIGIGIGIVSGIIAIIFAYLMSFFETDLTTEILIAGGLAAIAAGIGSWFIIKNGRDKKKEQNHTN